MRLPRALVLSALLGAAQAHVVGRQEATGGSSGSSGSSLSLAADSSSSSSAPGNSGSSTSSAAGGGDTNTDTNTNTAGGGGSSTDVTVTSTLTVTGGGGAGGTTTISTTSTTTVVVTSTAFATTTVTSSDGDTATRIVYDTTTVLVSPTAAQKRDARIAPKTAGPAAVLAFPTDLPLASYVVQDLRMRDLEKRATITQTVTVTVSGGSGSVSSVIDSIIETRTQRTTITNFVTETAQANARTTITSTSTLTVTSTLVTTGVVETITTTPTGQPGSSSPASSNSGGNNNNKSDSGLSTGAKAGIGVGAGVGGLAVIGILVWVFLRRRDHGPKPDPDDLVGASEVPVGGPSGGNRSRYAPMSRNSGAAAFLPPGRNPSKNPAPEGYRGTALGDGRAGYAKPDPYGSTYTPSPATTMANPTSPGAVDHTGAVDRHSAGGSPAAELGVDNASTAKWHDPNASEIDGNTVLNHQSGPVYEMPGQNYH